MEKAYCTKDKKTYRADEFAVLPKPRLERLRDYLTCLECKKKAYFRKAVNGTAPLFGASPHTATCGERSTDPAKVRPVVKDLSTYLSEGPQVVKLNLGSLKADDASDVDIPKIPRVDENKRQRPPSAGSSSPRNDWNLSVLLAELVRSPQLAEARHSIEAKGVFAAQPMAEFLVNTERLTPKDLGATKGFWGTISNANWGKDGSLWINSGPYWTSGVTLDVRVMPAIADQFLTRFPGKSPKDLGELPILVIGIADGYRVCVENLEHIAVLDNPA